jgi:hypothetical protein
LGAAGPAGPAAPARQADPAGPTKPAVTADARPPQTVSESHAAPPSGAGSGPGLLPFPAALRNAPRLQQVADQAARSSAVQYPVIVESNAAGAGDQSQVQGVLTAATQANSSLESKGAYLAEISGLSPAVALAWVTAENGVNNDILGVTNQNGLETFATWQQGIDAAVNLLRSSSDYASIRAAIASGNA